VLQGGRRRALHFACVEGLPQSPGALGAAIILLGLVLGAAFLVRTARAAPGGRGASWRVTLAIAAVTIAASFYATWRIASDIHYTSGLDSWLVPRYGVSVFHVHPAMFDAAAAKMPPHARYYLKVAPSVDSTRRQAFQQWSAGWLLPRIAVASPRRAGWIFTLGVDPASAGRPLVRTWRLWPASQGTPAAYLGEVRR
jgi:hypothetical protein